MDCDPSHNSNLTLGDIMLKRITANAPLRQNLARSTRSIDILANVKRATVL